MVVSRSFTALEAAYRFQFELRFMSYRTMQNTGNIFVAILVTLIAGCMTATTLVSSIGARALVGEVEYDSDNPLTIVEISKASLQPDCGGDIKSKWVPYQLCPGEKKETVGNVEIDISSIQFKKSMVFDLPDLGSPENIQRVVVKEAKLDLEVNGTNSSFEISHWSREQDKVKLYVKSEYREWYGYPAQLLLVVSVPVDVILTVPYLLGGGNI